MAPSQVTNNNELLSLLQKALGPAFSESEESFGQLRVRYSDPELRTDALRALKDAGFTFYCFCSAVDWPETDSIDVIDHVYDYRTGVRATIKVGLPRGNARIPTGTGVYQGADWHERETWEMFGVNFTGHPHLVRLLLPDWFEGYPMRKDYELEPRLEKPWPGDSFSG